MAAGGNVEEANADARDLVVAIMTARFAGDTELAMNLVQAAPDQGMLAWQLSGLADPLIHLAAADAGLPVRQWWREFAMRWAVVTG